MLNGEIEMTEKNEVFVLIKSSELLEETEILGVYNKAGTAVDEYNNYCDEEINSSELNDMTSEERNSLRGLKWDETLDDGYFSLYLSAEMTGRESRNIFIQRVTLQ